ncbi:hypothetical protein ACSHT2_02540 [Bradyrhizobium sp. PUT101]|uniref:hypothetical protein n=1 Tax=Bradyrhizobium sp. PUT101 TaxID=3447427 RepID=UPI003F836FDD
MQLKPETTGFVRGGMLFLEPPARWRAWQRDIWSCCCRSPMTLIQDRLTPVDAPPRIVHIATPGAAASPRWLQCHSLDELDD